MYTLIEQDKYTLIIIQSVILIIQYRSDDAIVVQIERKLTLINDATPPNGRPCKTPELT